MLNFIKILKSTLFTFIAKLSLRSFKNDLKVNGFTILNKRTLVGNNVHFNGLRIYGSGKTVIGDNFHSGKGCVIITSHHNYKGGKLPYDETLIVKDVRIEDNVWLGINVLILPGVKIGEGAIIQAGSVVSSSIPKLGIAGGNPARVFSSRDSSHYEELNNKKMFI